MRRRVHRPAPGDALPATGHVQHTTTTCQWCGLECGTVREHMVHATLAHPEAMGRGRTRSATWTCACDQQNAPGDATCTRCGRQHWSKA
jgi:hypothetical protein